MKKLLLTTVVAIATLSTAANAINIFVDGNKLDAEAKNLNGKTYVPVASVATATGSNVNWDNTTKTITITKQDTTLQIAINSKTATKNDTQIPLDTPAKIINGKTYVPLSFIASNLEIPLSYDNSTKSIYIGDSSLNPTIKEKEELSLKENNNPTPVSNQKRKYTIDDEREGVYIKGNLNSKIYHMPYGRDYYMISPKNVVWFETEQQAKNAGYRRAQQ